MRRTKTTIPSRTHVEAANPVTIVVGIIRSTRTTWLGVPVLRGTFADVASGDGRVRDVACYQRDGMGTLPLLRIVPYTGSHRSSSTERERPDKLSISEYSAPSGRDPSSGLVLNPGKEIAYYQTTPM